MRDLLARIDANEAQVERSGVDLFSYIAAGDDHVVLQDEGFDTEAVNGVTLVDWVTKRLEGESVDQPDRCRSRAAARGPAVSRSMAVLPGHRRSAR
ncbi:MAG: hypothetical protein ACRDQA_30490 [Nocardioidaceae bacterium]